jgi:tetratricopeptide (TPR) repeat protein
MIRIGLFASLLCGACSSSTQVTDASIEAAAAKLDFGDFKSSTLTTKAWKALDDEDYVAAIAYTRVVIERYGEEGRRMNASLSGFASSSEAHDYWALNDVGTSLFIAGRAYAELKMYEEAAQAFETLASEYRYCQCWDPKGWFWRPADNAAEEAKRYRRRIGSS